MMRAKGNEEALKHCQDKYNVPGSQENNRATMDWEARRCQMMCFLECHGPDVVVFNELDHYGQFLDLLGELGYVSQLPSSASSHPTYRPAHLDAFDDSSVETAACFQKAWEQRGYAFLPHLGSISMHIYMQNTKLGAKILEAAAQRGQAAKITDPKKGGLSRNWYKKLPPGASQELLRKAGLEDPASLDDMGVAIFWKQSRFKATGLRVQPYPGGGKGFVQVRLQDCRNEQRSIVVMGSHLSSGDAPQDEDERLQGEVVGPGGLRAAAQQLIASGENVVLCMDANSDPRSTSTTGSSCWRELRTTFGASVWDHYFDPEGKVIPEGKPGKDPPITTNKVRGPQSGQAKKIGSHAYHLIDHIFFDPRKLALREHVFEPKRFQSSGDALQHVLPSLENPSDHYPVIVDLAWVGPQ